MAYQPNFTDCKTLPDIYAVLFDAQAHGYRFSLPTAEVINAIYVRINYNVFPGARRHSDLEPLMQQITRIMTAPGFSEAPVYGATVLEDFKKAPATANTGEGRYWANGFLLERQQGVDFSRCQTPADFVAGLYYYLRLSMQPQPRHDTAQKKMTRQSGEPYTTKEIYDQIQTVMDFFERTKAGKGRFFPLDWDRISNFQDLRQYVQHTVLKSLGDDETVFPIMPAEFVREIGTTIERAEQRERPSDLRGIMNAPTRHIGRHPAAAQEPKERAPKVIFVEKPVPVPVSRSTSLLEAGGIAGVTLASLLCAGGVGVGGYAYLNRGNSDTGISFEDAANFEELSSEQREALAQLLQVGDQYYMPFVKSLMEASAVGITAQGMVSHDPQELITNLDLTNLRLHAMVNEGRVRVYVAHPGRETDIRFGNSVARLWRQDDADPANDLMLLDSHRFFAGDWHRTETLHHEAGHIELLSDRETHSSSTGALDRRSKAFGEAVLAEADYAFYMTALFSAVDTIIQYQVYDAKNAKDWKPVASGKPETQYADRLADWFEENNAVLQPFGINSDEIETAIVSSHLIEFGNTTAAEELAVVAREKAESQKKRPSELQRRGK